MAPLFIVIPYNATAVKLMGEYNVIFWNIILLYWYPISIPNIPPPSYVCGS